MDVKGFAKIRSRLAVDGLSSKLAAAAARRRQAAAPAAQEPLDVAESPAKPAEISSPAPSVPAPPPPMARDLRFKPAAESSRPSRAPVAQQQTRGDPAAGSAQAAPTPQEILRDAFTAPSSPLAGMPPQRLREIRALAQRSADATDGAATQQQFLAFLTNDAAALPRGGDDAWTSPRATWMMATLLHKVGQKIAQSPQEHAALAHLMHSYRDLMVSSAVHRFYKTHPGLKKEHHDIVQQHLVGMALHHDRPGLLRGGYDNHYALMRVALLPEQEAGAGFALTGYRARAEHAAGGGDAGKALRGTLQVDMTDAQFASPVIQNLITAQSCMLRPSRGPQGEAQVIISQRAADGTLAHQTLAPHEAVRALRSMDAKPLSNGVKITTHNGGDAARIAPDGTSRSFSERLHVPLVSCPKIIGTLQHAAITGPQEHGQALASLRDYHADRAESLALSPKIAAQALGNCTVHSQKLALLYELQHPQEHGNTLTEQQGTQLFKRLWEGVIKSAEASTPAGAASTHVARAAVNKELTWLAAVRSTPAPARVAAAVPQTPAGPARRIPVAQFLATPAAPSPAVAPALPQAAPAALATYARGQVPSPALVQWARDIRHTDWTPTTVAELRGFRALLSHFRGPNPTPAQHQHAQDWIRDSGASDKLQLVSGAFIADPTASPEAQALARTSLFARFHDTTLASKRISSALFKAWAAAARHDPVADALWQEMRQPVAPPAKPAEPKEPDIGLADRLPKLTRLDALPQIATPSAPARQAGAAASRPGLARLNALTPPRAAAPPGLAPPASTPPAAAGPPLRRVGPSVVDARNPFAEPEHDDGVSVHNPFAAPNA